MPEAPLLNNRYQLIHRIGSGGMAMVYQARDMELERPVAIKILREDYSRDPAFRERFRQEARAAANLSHPNIVTVHDFGLDKDHLFIVMEHVPGTDLKTHMKQHGRFSVEESLRLIIQACAGLGYAHRAGLVHCDVKPHNMLVTPDMRLKVTDFGIARALASIQPHEKSEYVWGSPQYFSPEQASGDAPSPASDVYSLGVILYEMLTGRLPFISDSPQELCRMHQSVKPIPPQNFNSAIPDTLNQIIMKILSKEASARYRTADQLGHLLRNFSQTLPGPGTPGHVNAVPPTQRSPIPDTSPQILVAEGDEEIENNLGIDWVTIGLGLLTVIAVGGLIPFWISIYFSVSPVVH